VKHIAIGALVILLVITSMPDAHGQTRRNQRRSRRSRAVKTVRPAANSAVMTTPSGLIYIITKRSEGRYPRPGETVAVNYTGLLTSGVKFDSSHDRGQPYKFKLGLGRVIKGWDEGIEKLRVGEQATLIIPPQLGYGPAGSGDVIPPNATLIFIVELMEIEGP
jgi:FKBP-type peptidyl-prolyl cis-trans isomerase